MPDRVVVDEQAGIFVVALLPFHGMAKWWLRGGAPARRKEDAYSAVAGGSGPPFLALHYTQVMMLPRLDLSELPLRNSCFAGLEEQPGENGGGFNANLLEDEPGSNYCLTCTCAAPFSLGSRQFHIGNASS